MGLEMDVQYPCGGCKLEVKDGHQAVQCEGPCSSWFHCSCGLGLKLSSAQYKRLDTEETWMCANCCGDHSLPTFNSVNAVDVFHFDFQQNMPTPKLTVSKQFYMRLLWTYLFGIFCASINITCGFLWNELVAHRGANDVVSCLSRFIYDTRFGRTGAKWSVWWADNCAGQNKNNCVIWFFQDLIRKGVYSRIDYKFLVVGHTYGPTDRCFGVIEKYLSQIENVYTPQEWYKHVRDSAVNASSRVEVIEMHQDCFGNHRDHLRHMYTERNKDVEGKPLEFSKVLWFNFGVGEMLVNGAVERRQHPQEVWARYTYDLSETPRRVSFYKKSNFKVHLQHFPPPLYASYPLGIKAAKAADLKKLAMKYLPDTAKDMYLDLPAIELEESEDSDSD